MLFKIGRSLSALPLQHQTLPYGRYVFSVMGSALFRYSKQGVAEGVRPYKPPFAGSGQFVKATDPGKQPLLKGMTPNGE